MKKYLSKVLLFLGIAAFTEKEGKKVLTEDQRAKLASTFTEDFAAKFEAALANDFTDETASADDGQLDKMLATVADLQSQLTALETDKTALQTEKDSLSGQISQMQAQIDILSIKPEPDTAGAGAGSNVNKLMDNKFLLGQNVPFMAIDDKHAYNKRAYAALMLKQGIEIPAPVAESFDYESLKADLGDFYRVRKQDRIQSFLLGLPSLAELFPLESGYQDEAALVNLFPLGDFSQADNTGASTFDNVVKGGFKFEAEKLKMYDVMFAHSFNNLKALEKQWIGYLNKEGSDVMKWSFIEFIMSEVGKLLNNEQQLRRVNGIRKNPTANVPGTAMEAADGWREFLKKQIALFKIRPFELGEWDDTNIADYVRRGTALVPLPVRETGKCLLYMSYDAVVAYHKNLETLYGLMPTFKPDTAYVKEYPNIPIKIVPNLGESKRMVWTLEGNFILAEDMPGEMFKFNFEQRDWSLKVWSNWKESVWAYMIGRKWNSLAEIPTDYSTQMIFCNDVDYPVNYYIPMTAGDATPSVARHTSLVTVANVDPLAITNIDDAVVGKEIRIKCGSATNAPTIAATGNFSLLTGAWSPAVGDVLVLVKRADGKFFEVERKTSLSDILGFAADDATPSVEGADTFVTSENVSACAITNFDNAIYDRVYTIYGAGSVHPSTIANSGNFVLTAAMTLGDGAWIKLQKNRVNNKFYEISRS